MNEFPHSKQTNGVSLLNNIIFSPQAAGDSSSYPPAGRMNYLAAELRGIKTKITADDIFFFCALGLYICLYRIFIPMTPNRIDIVAFDPKLPSPKTFFNFRMKLENLFCCNALDKLNYFARTQRGYILYQKVYIIFIRSYFNKLYLISLRYLYANILQRLINCFTEYNPPVFRRAYKMMKY